MRISVVGASGTGKTTLALRLAAALGLPRIELNAMVEALRVERGA